MGEGGCGVVYVAEQTEPVRQALAMMDHPNIAKVLDAGTTESPVAAGILPAVEPGFQPGGKSDGNPAGLKQLEAIADSTASPGGKMPPFTAGGSPHSTMLGWNRSFMHMTNSPGVNIVSPYGGNGLRNSFGANWACFRRFCE